MLSGARPLWLVYLAAVCSLLANFTGEVYPAAPHGRSTRHQRAGAGHSPSLGDLRPASAKRSLSPDSAGFAGSSPAVLPVVAGLSAPAPAGLLAAAAEPAARGSRPLRFVRPRGPPLFPGALPQV